MNAIQVQLKRTDGSEYIYNTQRCLVAPSNLLPLWPTTEQYRPHLKQITAEDVEGHLKRQGYAELILEVTEACNFRCEYCVYSQLYPNYRGHGFGHMPKERALAATKWYLDMVEETKEYNPLRKPVVTFYGGEPLVNWRTLRDCVEFAESYSTQPCLFLLTTNGSLVSQRIADFFAEHNVTPTFSLDGPANEHNRNRRFTGGKPTYSRVMAGINRYINSSQKQAFVNTVYDPGTDLFELKEFFTEHDEIIPFSITPVNPFNTSYYEQFSSEIIARSLKQFESMLEAFIHVMASPPEDSRITERRFLYALVGRSLLIPFLKTHDREQTSQLLQYSGSCIPGYKIYVATDGSFHACERVEHSRPIGDLDKGLDCTKIAKILNEIGRLMRVCSGCDIRNTCGLCLQSFLSHGTIGLNRDICRDSVREFYGALTSSIALSEMNPSWIERYTSEYHDVLGQASVRLD